MNEAKKRNVIFALIAVAIAVVFFFAGFGAGYGAGKGAVDAPEPKTVESGNSLRVEDKTSDGLQIRTLSAAAASSSSVTAPEFNFLSDGENLEGDYTYSSFPTGFFFDEGGDVERRFPFDSFTVLKVSYSDGTEIDSSAEIIWTLTCEDCNAEPIDAESGITASDPWKEAFQNNPYGQSDCYDRPELVFLDLGVYSSDHRYARLGCKCPFFFPTEVSVRVIDGNRVSAASCSVDYRRSGIVESKIELSFENVYDTIASRAAFGGHDNFYGIDYTEVRIPVYSYGLVSEDLGVENDVAYALLDDYLGSGGLSSYEMTSAGSGVIRKGSGLRYFAYIVGQAVSGEYDYDTCMSDDFSYETIDSMGFVEFCKTFWTLFDSSGIRSFMDVRLWTLDDISDLPEDSGSISEPLDLDVEVMFPSLQYESPFMLRDPYRAVLESEEFSGISDIISYQFVRDTRYVTEECYAYYFDLAALKEFFSGSNSTWDLFDFCYFPGYSAMVNDGRLYLDREQLYRNIVANAEDYLKDPAAYRWVPSFYLKIGESWCGFGLDYSGGPGGYHGVNG